MGRRLALLLSFALLAACGSTPPSEYYVLTAGGGGTPGGQRPAIGIAPVQVAAYLDRNRIVTSAAGSRLDIAATRRWGEPLAAGVQRVLRVNLARLTGSSNVQVFPWSGPPPAFVVSVSLLSLDAGAGRAELVAQWRVSRGVEQASPRRITTLETSIRSGTDQAATSVAAWSDLLFRLSGEIAAAIEN